MLIRHAEIRDVKAIADLEEASFPPSDAASYERMDDRVRTYPDYICLGWEDDKLASFVIGLRSDDEDLSDEMFASASLHNPSGRWIHILSVATATDLREKGCASVLMKRMLEDCRERGLEGSVLTCKPHLVGYYERFGYVDEGVCDSQHGGAVWHQMRIRF